MLGENVDQGVDIFFIIIEMDRNSDGALARVVDYARLFKVACGRIIVAHSDQRGRAPVAGEGCRQNRLRRKACE